MSLPGDQPLQKLQFYVTTGYSCGYLPNKMAQSLIASPQHLVDTEVYNSLIHMGFRRSGKFVYRPHCENCQECVPVRIVIDKFTPNRSQKRAFKQHQTLTTKIVPAGFYEEHYALYAAYQLSRHSDPSKMDSADQHSEESQVEQYQNFLCQSNVESVLVEFREGLDLKMVSVIDIMHDGISAVYTFYDVSDLSAETNNSISKRPSFGTFNIMWQLEWAKSMGLPYLYLGYWIKDSPKMAYKQNFRPLEKLINNRWINSET